MLLQYAVFIMLSLCFLVMQYSLHQFDVGKYKWIKMLTLSPYPLGAMVYSLLTQNESIIAASVGASFANVVTLVTLIIVIRRASKLDTTGNEMRIPK